jgi:hypothetical protein
MLVLHSPEPDVFLAAGDELVGVDWAKLDGQDVEIADLLGQQLGLFVCFNLADIKDENGLSLVGIEPHHCQMLPIAEPDLLDLLVGALEARNALMVNPNSD